MALSGCNRHKTTIGLDVDLYVHPTSADPLDIILQTAISKRLNDAKTVKLSLIHVRVEDKLVILTGTSTDEGRKEAGRITMETVVTLNGEPIRFTTKNQITTN